MFLDIDKKESSRLAILDDSGYSLTYGELCDIVIEFEQLEMPRSVVFLLCENCAGALAGFTAFESGRQVPLMLSAALDRALLKKLEDTYRPCYYWLAERFEKDVNGSTVYSKLGYKLIKTEYEPYPINDKLSLLLTTSGSTGSPKLVRHKYGNIESNAENAARAFGWTSDERGICNLPMNYTMGLNVINSHLFAGASVLMIKRNLMDPEFWEFIRAEKGTNFCGVPYSYEIMRRIGFDKMELPDLRTLAEGGGKLTDKMFVWLTELCEKTGRRFCATFGTSETSARMAFLDPELAKVKTGSIGKAIWPCEIFLADEKESEDGGTEGELCCRGPNVTMGYAECIEDLLRDDEFYGEYHTGDIARRDADGFYYIIGRGKRFLKLFGFRVSLDEAEQLIKSEYGCDVVCSGDDRKMNIFITDESLKNEIRSYISEKTHIHVSAFKVTVVETIPHNEYGKVKLAQFGALAK